MKPDRTLLALAAAVLPWASAFPAIRVALRGYGAAELSFLRLAVASVAPAVVAAACAQAAYHLGIKPLLRTYTGLEVAAYAMWAGTVLLLPLAPTALRAALHAPTGPLLAAVHLGALPSAAGFVVRGYAVARRTVTAATAALNLVPAATPAVAYVWLGERPRPVEVLGGLLTIAGVAVAGRGTVRLRPGHPAEPIANLSPHEPAATQEALPAPVRSSPGG
ncbi:DMT family transporter [Streptomyces sp. NPDC005728]|uniref:DMT family transporter n=1 Tax=Streptomyces sp. NPDC005728 TaxID=3157054 RepID=UPI003407A543